MTLNQKLPSQPGHPHLWSGTLNAPLLGLPWGLSVKGLASCRLDPYRATSSRRKGTLKGVPGREGGEGRRTEQDHLFSRSILSSSQNRALTPT